YVLLGSPPSLLLLIPTARRYPRLQPRVAHVHHRHEDLQKLSHFPPRARAIDVAHLIVARRVRPAPALRVVSRCRRAPTETRGSAGCGTSRSSPTRIPQRTRWGCQTRHISRRPRPSPRRVCETAPRSPTTAPPGNADWRRARRE